MSIFTAGCIESTRDSKKIRDQVYSLAKHDLDSSAMKISVRKSPTCINFIAFLPKDKIKEENILKKVSECEAKSVVIFELDYKQVGVICEQRRIVDYILDKPAEFALEMDYPVHVVNNMGGVKLVHFNLSEDSKKTRAGFITLGFTILLTTTMFYSGYFYMQNTNINKTQKESLVQEYKKIVKNEFSSSEKMTKKIDITTILEDVERLTQASHATLQKVKYDEKSICVDVKTLQLEPFLSIVPKNATIKQKDELSGRVEYCYETI